MLSTRKPSFPADTPSNRILFIGNQSHYWKQFLLNRLSHEYYFLPITEPDPTLTPIPHLCLLLTP